MILPALAERGPELGLATKCCGGTRPKRIVELEPECHEQSKAHRRPQSKSEQQRRTNLCRLHEGRRPSANSTCNSDWSGLVECVCHYELSSICDGLRKTRLCPLPIRAISFGDNNCSFRGSP